MKILSTIQPNGGWTAIDADSYDAECDVNGYWSRCPMGWGKTEADAVADLLEQMGHPIPAPEREPIEQALASIERALDSVVSMAVTPATYPEVEAAEEDLWRIKGHVEFLVSYIREKQAVPARLRAVK